MVSRGVKYTINLFRWSLIEPLKKKKKKKKKNYGVFLI
jgi:hypothetical protein